MKRPVVAIVGKPNVGKSTLFNRLMGRRISIVEETPGVTRDQVSGETEIQGIKVTLVDTGGFLLGDEKGLTPLIVRQVEKAIEEADLLIFVVDARQDPSLPDFQITDRIRRSGKPILFVANKADTLSTPLADFWELGLGEPLAISALHGRNISALLEGIAESVPSEPAPTVAEEPQPIRIAIVGRPNVGKSSLVNAILGQERVIVSPIPGTTRDAIDTPFEWKGIPMVLTDTAGLRKKSAITKPLDFFTQLRALSAIDRSDVTVLVIDGKEGMTRQDARIASYSDEKGKPLILVVSKWDLVASQLDGDEKARARRERTLQADFTRFLRNELPFVPYAPVLYVSAVQGWGISQILKKTLECYSQWQRRIPTADVNRWLGEAVTRHPPPPSGNRAAKFFYATQPQVAPPTFVFFVNDPELVPATYLRYLENSLRRRFDFRGTPIRLVLRRRSRRLER